MRIFEKGIFRKVAALLAVVLVVQSLPIYETRAEVPALEYAVSIPDTLNGDLDAGETYTVVVTKIADGSVFDTSCIQLSADSGHEDYISSTGNTFTVQPAAVNCSFDLIVNLMSGVGPEATVIEQHSITLHGNNRVTMIGADNLALSLDSETGTMFSKAIPASGSFALSAEGISESGVNYSWNITSGDGIASLTNADAKDATLNITGVGTVTVLCTVTKSGYRPAFKSMTIVVSAGSVAAPDVYLDGASQDWSGTVETSFTSGTHTFSVANASDMPVGATYAWSITSGDGTVVSATSAANTDSFTVQEVHTGGFTVALSISADGYATANWNRTITVKAGTLPDLNLKMQADGQDVTDLTNSIHYQDEKTYTLVHDDIAEASFTTKCEREESAGVYADTTDISVSSEGVITMGTPGTYKITVTGEKPDYDDKIENIIFTVKPGIQTISGKLYRSDDADRNPVTSIDYEDGVTYTILAECAGAGIKYEVTAEDGSTTSVAEAADNVVTIKSTGTFKVKATATKTNFEDAVWEETITVNAGEIHFSAASILIASGDTTETAVTSLTYGSGTYQVVADTEEKATLSYEVKGSDGSSTTDVASIDPAGNVTINKAGTFVIKVTADKANYDSKTETITITVNRADRVFDFEQSTKNVPNSVANAEVQTITIQETCGCSLAPTYSIVSGADLVEGDINSATGAVTIKEGVSGDIVIKANVAECDHYNAAEATYTLRVEGFTLPDGVTYSITGTAGENGYYRGESVKVTAPDGYLIRKEGQSDWVPDYTLTEGENTFNLQFKETSTSKMTTTPVAVSVKVDTVAPSELAIAVPSTSTDLLVETLLSLFYDDDVTVTFTAVDSTAGVDHFEYWFNDDMSAKTDVAATKSTGSTYTASITIVEDQLASKLTIVAVDKAGNRSDAVEYKNDSKTTRIIVDKTAPVLTLNLPTENSYTANSETLYTGDVSFALTATDKWLDFASFTVTDKSDTLTTGNTNPNVKAVPAELQAYLQNSTNWTTRDSVEYTLNAPSTAFFTNSGDYSFEISVSDYAGNNVATTQQTFHIVKEAPTLTTTGTINKPSGENTVVDSVTGITYSASNKLFYEATTDDKYYDYATSPLTITAKVDGVEVPASDVVSTSFAEGTLKYTLVADASKTIGSGLLELSATYTDFAGRETSAVTFDKLYLDRTAPVISVHFEGETTELVDYRNYYKNAESTKLILTVEDKALSMTDTYSLSSVFNVAGFDMANRPLNGFTNGDQGLSLTKVEGTDTYTAELELTIDGIYMISVRNMKDIAGNESTTGRDFNVILDNTVPEINDIKIAQTPITVADVDCKYFDRAVDVTVEATSTINELTSMEVFIKPEGATEYTKLSVSPTIGPGAGLDKFIGTFTLDAATVGESPFEFKVVAAPDSDKGNPSVATAYGSKLAIDMTAPVISCDTAFAGGDGDVTATAVIQHADTTVNFTITEANLLTAKDGYKPVVQLYESTPAAVVGTYEWKAAETLNLTWTKGADGNYTASYTLNQDGLYYLTVECMDPIGRTASITTKNIRIDKVAPVISQSVALASGVEGQKVTVEGLDYYNNTVEVALTVTDDSFDPAGVSIAFDATAENSYSEAATGAYNTYLQTAANWTKQADATNTYTATLTFAEEYLYNYVISVENLGTSTTDADAIAFVVDKTAPVILNTDAVKAPVAPTGSVSRSEAVITGLDVNGNSFTGYAYNGKAVFRTTLTEVNYFANSLTYKVYKDGVLVTDKASCSAKTVTRVGTTNDYTVEITVGDNGSIVDGVYSVEVTYTDMFGNETTYTSNKVAVDGVAPVSTVAYDGALLTASPTTPYIFGTKEVVTITVTDRFLTNNTATSFTGSANPKVTVSAVDIKGATVIAAAPVSLDWTKSGDVWTADYTVEQNGIYTVVVEAVDAATNTAEVQTRSFTVDDSEAGVKSIAISQTKDTTFDGVDLYKADSIEVVATVESDSSEVTELTWKMTQRRPGQGTDTIISDTVKKGDAGVSFVREAGSNITTVTFTISADTLEQFAGMLSATAKTTAKAGTTYVTYANTFAVDNVAPVGAVSSAIAGGNGDIAADPVIFNGSATATFTITEANFKAIVGENPNTAIKAMLYTAVADATTAELSWDEGEEVALTWSSNGAANTASYTISTDGNYYMTLEYTDPVGHEMTSITTKTILVDTVNPVLNFEVSGGSTAAGDVQYHQAAISVVITVVEKNFYPNGVTVSITGENAAGAGVGSNFGAGLNWSHNGDTHTASITLAENAIYSISGSATDLAGRSSTGGVSTKHAVDNVAPAGLNVAYSTSILDQILEQISFGFYKAPVTVTVSATDETSGVTAFEYSYLKASNVSGINGQAEKIRIDEGSIAYGNGRQAASATFQVPNDGGQFNGTVSVTATDRAGNSSEFADSKRVVVDNIAPTAEVTYNAPVSDGNGTKYFDTAITANIRIKEANFFRDDVHVSVSRNNGAFAPEAVNWSDGADDMHTASLTFAEEGQYRLNIEYADKSTNEMTAYQSDLMIVDTIVPVMTIDSVKSNVAYADDTVGFVITVSDENLEESSFNPSVSGWVKENGSFTQKSFTAEGTQAVSDGGKTITYTIANLPADGIYTVTSSVADKANHYVDKMTSTAQDNAEVDSVRFSVNRVGSTYGILDEATKNLIGNFKNYADVKDVVVTETNPTALSNISVTLYRDEQTLKLDESSFELSVDHKEGEWYEYTYRVKRENFKEDGVYSVSFYSEDEAGHQSENTLETKNTVITFGVDSTVPTLIVANLENDETYDATEYVVTMQASDNLGLTKVLAKIDNKTVGEWTADGEGDAALSSNDEYEFTIQESSETQKVVIELTDKAGNQTTGEFDVLVTTNTMVRFVNNKPLVYGTVGGVAGVGIVTPIVVVAAKKKGEFMLFKLIRKLFGK